MVFKKHKLSLFIFSTATLLFKAITVFAQETNSEVINTIGQGVSKIFSIALTISVVLAAIVIAFGAIYYLLSFIREQNKEEGKDWIKAGITGLLIIMCSYLIISTINPAIFNFTWYNLPKLIFNLGGVGVTNPGDSKLIYYDQIPLGKLSEEILTGKMDCYDFDPDGNPIPVPFLNENQEKILGPTFINHDRIDCYLKLADAAEKKSRQAEQLGKEITELMQQCSCEGRCKDPEQSWFTKCSDTDPAGGSGCFTYSLLTKQESSCRLPDNATRSPLDNDFSLSCCPENIRTQIRGYINNHGEGRTTKNKNITPFVFATTDQCTTSGECSGELVWPYYGLDEFYTTKGSISGAPVEKKTKMNKKDVNYIPDKEITYIDLGNCPVCATSCECAPDDKDCQKNQPKCTSDRQKCLNEKQKCLLETPWGKLNLVEQSMYLNEKINDIKLAIQKDADKLSAGSEKLANCPVPKSFLDFTKTDEALYKNQTILISDKGGADIEKYCNGFNYQNSQCYQQCSDSCPITKEDLSCYDSCAKEIDCTSIDEKKDPAGYKKCIDKKDAAEKVCSEKCYQNRKCIYNQNFPTFKSCMSTCSNTCESTCAGKFATCSDEYKACQQGCKGDSACLMGNLDSCVINTDALASCKKIAEESSGDADKIDAQIKKCIESAYLCKAGSLLNSSYPECITDATSSDLFSSSYLYKNPEKQVCPYPFAKQNPYTGEKYYDANGKNVACIEAKPETAKCPASVGNPSLTCPDCKCNEVKEDFTFSLENKISPQEIDSCVPADAYGDYGDGLISSGESSCSTVTKKVEEYRITGPQCSEPAFNGDPLTFYCRQDWWFEPITQRPKNLGTTDDKNKNLVCDTAQEIPVGYMVDHTLRFVDEFFEKTKGISDSLSQMVSYMKKLGYAKEYCACDSKYEASGNPVCRACCNYVPGQDFYDEEGEYAGTTPDYCQPESCKGNSCQQMINWLQEFINHHHDIKSSYIDFFIYLTKEPRTDILKELTYARNKTDTCSALQTNTGLNNARMLSCQQALDDILYPITDSEHNIIIDQEQIYHYCYGSMTGTINNNSAKTDNWLCCETTQQTEREPYSPYSPDPYSNYGVMGSY